jgi:hypothetical protein
MSLNTGAKLGPYEIVASLGSGGMGEVYRARDTRLNRDVAIKVLPTEFAKDAGRLARFEQEAKATAALNHPNIVAVFDVGVESQQPYVVSELLEGGTLRDALSDGALPQRTAVDIAIQIAQGLAAAHQKGIVHRDVKPENVFLTTEGRAKILDFGLAKLAGEAADARAGASIAATMRPQTTPGMVLGTVGYMSPEQVRGEPTDHRTDIFAFGAVFYEMLSGQRAFKRDTAAETMTAILKEDPPDLTSGVRPMSPTFDRIIRRCLEKNPQLRFQSASDVAFALDALSGSAASSSAAAVRAPTRRWWRRVAIGAAVAAAFATGVVVARRPDTKAPGVVTFVAKTFDVQAIMNARFMPDGQTIVYSAATSGATPNLFVIRPDSEAPQPLGVSKAQLLSVSSKGELAIITNAQHIGLRLFSGTLARMTIGNAPRPMLEHVREADWSPDGSALAIIHDLGNGRDRLEYPVGTALHEASGYLSDVRVSPDGNHVAFFEHQFRFDDMGWVKVVDLGGHVTTLAGEYYWLEGLAWAPDGTTIVFSASDADGLNDLHAFAVPASGRSKALTVFGSPGRFIVYDVARDGRWLATREDMHVGVRARVPSQPGERDVSWLGSSMVTDMSADGEWLLLNDLGPNGGVVLRKTDGSPAVRLGEGASKKFSPDGKWASAIIATPLQLVIYPRGPGQAIKINPGPIERYQGAVQWFPDSKRLLACGSEPSRALRCYVQDVGGSPPKPVTPEGVAGTVAPDGRTLLLTLPDGTFQLSSMDGGAAQPVVGLQTDDGRIAWGRDSRSMFVQRGRETAPPATVERVELTTGRRTVVLQIAPEGAGLGPIATVRVGGWADEGRWYAYSYWSTAATLFVVSGALQR